MKPWTKIWCISMYITPAHANTLSLAITTWLATQTRLAKSLRPSGKRMNRSAATMTDEGAHSPIVAKVAAVLEAKAEAEVAVGEKERGRRYGKGTDMAAVDADTPAG